MEPDTRNLSSSSPPGKLRGAQGRYITGVVNIACGTAEVVTPIIVIVIATRQSGTGILTVVGGIGVLIPLGISYAILVITAGCFGNYSRKGQCQTVTYLVLCVVLAIFTAAGTIYLALLTALQVNGRYRYYGSTIYTLLIFNTIVFALHCVVAIVGASFTCSAVCCVPDTRVSQQPMSVQPVVLQPSPQQPMGVAGAAMPSAYTNPTMEQSTVPEAIM